MSNFRRYIVKRSIDQGNALLWAREAFQATTLEELYNRVTVNATIIFKCPICVLLLLKEDYLLIESSSGLKHSQLNYHKIIIGKSVSGRIVKLGEPKLFSDLSEYLKTIPDNIEPYYNGSMAATPLVFDKKIIGLINICRPSSLSPISYDDLNNLITYANQIAFAITSQQLVDKRTKELKETQKALEEIKKDLEIKVKERTIELAKVNEELQQDIIQRKHVEKELATAHMRFKNVLDAATQVAIVATDINGMIILFNTGAEQMLDYGAEEIIGKHTPEIFHFESEKIAYGENLSQKYGYKIEDFDIFTTNQKVESDMS